MESGASAQVTHDIVINDQLVFKVGEAVTIEAVSSNVQRPEYKYVVTSTLTGARFQLSDADLRESAPEPVDKRQCPYCKEDIHPQAIKCKHCGSILTNTEPSVLAARHPQSTQSPVAAPLPSPKSPRTQTPPNTSRTDRKTVTKSCTACGAQVPVISKRCKYCGKKLAVKPGRAGEKLRASERVPVVIQGKSSPWPYIVISLVLFLLVGGVTYTIYNKHNQERQRYVDISETTSESDNLLSPETITNIQTEAGKDYRVLIVAVGSVVLILALLIGNYIVWRVKSHKYEI